ncbi:MAG: hypothetical protein AB7O78_16190 [Thermoleophilia bacterium]
MHVGAMEWWPTLVMSGVYVAAWAAIIWIAGKALTDHRRRGPR